MEIGQEGLRKKSPLVERIRRKIDSIIHPASSASEDAFRSIIAVLPQGDMKKSMQMVMPQLRDLLKTQDRALFIGSIMQRAIGSVVFGTFGGFGGAIADSIFLTPGIGTGIGIATGIGFAFANPTVSQMERSRIAMVGKQQEMMLRTTGGKEAAKVFDSKRVDDITRAILWGNAAQGGGGGIMREASS